jgi:ABC-type sugar transport system ATPase subunit
LENVFLGIEPRRVARDLAVAEQKMTEIMKALARKASFIIMDEPTDALSDAETAHLHTIIADLRRRGITLLYITHFLDEAIRITDRITVLKDGRKVETRATGDLDRDTLVRMMIGQEPARRQAPGVRPRGPEALRVEGLVGAGVDKVAFRGYRGEILGVTGVLGSGKTELARLLFGADRAVAGTVTVGGRVCRIRTPRDAVRNGIGMLPEDRKRQGLILGHEVYKNVSIVALRSLSRGIFLRLRREREETDSVARRLGIKVARAEQPVRDLSGGNQQKVVLAKWLLARKEILIMDEPTRGIDVGSRAEIHRIMRELADGGACIIFITAEVPEVVRVADRILVMRQGRAAEELGGGSSQEDVMHAVLRGNLQ